jgi:hypothetical protein
MNVVIDTSALVAVIVGKLRLEWVMGYHERQEASHEKN